MNLDPTIGSEIAKTRPVLFVSNNISNQFSSTVTVLPLTSKTEMIYPCEVVVLSEESGLLQPSKIKENQIRTIDKQRLGEKIGTLQADKMKEVEQSVLTYLSSGVAI